VDDSLVTASGASTVTQITNIEAQLQSTGSTITVPNFSGKLGQTALTGSAKSGPDGVSLHLSIPSIANADLPSLFALAGMPPMSGLSIGGASPVDVTTTIGSDLTTFTVNGTAAFEKLTMNSITLTHLKSPFRFEKKIFTLDPMTFDLYGGHQSGTVTVGMVTPTPTFTIKTTTTGLDVNQALSATTTMKNKLDGTARLVANVRGSGTSQAAIEKTLAGTVGFALTNGVLHNFPLTSAINSALGAVGQGGTSPDLKFTSLSGTAAIANGHATTNDLALKSDLLALTGAGTYGFDQSVAFKLKAGLSAAASSQIAGKVSFASRLEDSQGQITFPVNVTGTASSPKFGVDVKSAATQQVKQQVGGLLNQLIKKKP
jgi:AsmA protein